MRGIFGVSTIKFLVNSLEALKSPTIGDFFNSTAVTTLSLIDRKPIVRNVHRYVFEPEMIKYEQETHVKRGVHCLACGKPTQVELRHICQHLMCVFF